MNWRELFFLKSDDFASEHEHRAVLFDVSDEFAHVSFQDALLTVMVGERFPKWKLAGAREVCDAAGVTLSRMHWGRPRALNAPPPVLASGG